MKWREIQEKARGLCIRSHGLGKTDLIRSIQRAEHNLDCYGTDRVGVCQEKTCVWKIDCMAQAGIPGSLGSLDALYLEWKKNKTRSIAIISQNFLSKASNP
jgi:hypothetical protein